MNMHKHVQKRHPHKDRPRRTNKNVDQFNLAVGNYNLSVKSFQSLQGDYNLLIDSYNLLFDDFEVDCANKSYYEDDMQLAKRVVGQD